MRTFRARDSLCWPQFINRVEDVDGFRFMDPGFDRKAALDCFKKYMHEESPKRDDEVSSYTHELHSRFWEMFLVTSFLEDGLHLINKGSADGPDFKIDLGDRVLWVEAVIAGPGSSSSDNRVPAPVMGMAVDVPHDLMILRLANSFETKFKKYKCYCSKELVTENDLFVIAINGCLVGSHPEALTPRIVQTLFPVGHTVLSLDKEDLNVTGQHLEYRDRISKDNESEVFTNSFLNDNYMGIDAVLYSDCNFLNLISDSESTIQGRLSRLLTLVHNPSGCFPSRAENGEFLRCGKGYYFVKSRNPEELFGTISNYEDSN